MNHAKRAKDLLQGFEIVKFDIKSLKFEKNNWSREKNDEIFIEWLSKLLRKYNSTNTMCVSMNSKNVYLLQDYLSTSAWLNYAPEENNELRDDELKIDLNKLNE